MSKRRRLSFLSFSTVICLAVASSDRVARQAAVKAQDPAQGPAKPTVDVLVVVPSSADDRSPLRQRPLQTPIGRLMETRSLPSAPCAITTAPIAELYRRQMNDQAVTIVFLSSALSSAHSDALAVSRSLASSISQLQLSASVLASSASSAILSVQASASRALQAVEASASDAVLLAEESASSRISEVLASAAASAPTLPVALVPSNRTYQAQAMVMAQDNSVSVAVVAGAVVASVVGSTLLSIVGFYLFTRHRNARRKKREEQRRQEEEVIVNAALDRAIVSYIAKESPPTTPDRQDMGRRAMAEEAIGLEQRPTFLAIPPRSPSRRQPSLATISIPPRTSATISSVSSSPTQSPIHPVIVSSKPLPLSLRSPTPPSQNPSPISNYLIGSPPPGPPPAMPLPQLPNTTYMSRKGPRRTPSRSTPDDSGRVYGDILKSPLEPNTPVSPSVSSQICLQEPSRRVGGPDEAQQPEGEESNRPLNRAP